MKALCITGADNTTLEAIAAPFYKAGMRLPQSSGRERTINFTHWHQQVADKLASQKPIGRLWENVATDLLLANLENNYWGWYEEQSAYALDFWADLEPNICFILVCTRLEEELCQKITQSKGAVDAEVLIKNWHNRHNKLLQFYLKHPQRCLLIDAQDAQQYLQKTLLLAHDYWQHPLDQNVTQESLNYEQLPPKKSVGTIMRLIAREAIKKAAVDIQGFYTELRAAQHPLTDLEQNNGTASELFDWLKQEIDLSTVNHLLEEYQDLQYQAEQAKQIPVFESQNQHIQSQLKETEKENELLLLQLHQVQEELESTLQRQQQSDKAKQVLEAQLVKAQSEPKIDPKVQQQLEQAQQENELLLLQLHQVQEELEHYFLQHQKLNERYQVVNNEYLGIQANYKQLKHQLDYQQAINQQLEQSWPASYPKPQPPLAELQYEAVELHNEQVNRDYEHLWIKLKNPVFSGNIADQWSFRISNAIPRPDAFGQHPKLELPQQDEQLLHQWFEESVCDYGSKLELRFALPESMDLGVWQQIVPHDQQLIRTLIKQLPEILLEIEQAGTRISRSWQDWQRLANDMKHILEQTVGA